MLLFLFRGTRTNGQMETVNPPPPISRLPARCSATLSPSPSQRMKPPRCTMRSFSGSPELCAAHHRRPDPRRTSTPPFLQVNPSSSLRTRAALSKVRPAALRSVEAHSSPRSNTHRTYLGAWQANRARVFRNSHCRLGSDSTREERGQITIIGDDVEADLGGSPLALGLWRVHVRMDNYRPGDAPRRCQA
ncbi:hypothetical protein FB451DRAFT_190767 [Mycena latifolia]|nr:hypothetical protein FB451DRAFT_190767 [Mycena latifolia]